MVGSAHTRQRPGAFGNLVMDDRVTLRAVGMGDAERLFAWQRDPRTRRHFREPGVPEWDGHVDWLRRKLADPRCRLWILLHDGEAAGAVRLDARHGGDFEVSILVEPGRYRLGLAAAALRLVREQEPDATLVAEVLPGNAASEALFRAGGYRRRADGLLANVARRAVFRLDASPTIGGGHACRCLRLADSLAGFGWRCTFAVGPATTATVPALAASGHAVQVVNGDEAGGPGPADLLVVDHYQRDREFESRCRAWADMVVVIDDLADRPHDCDVLLDQTFGRDPADYLPLVPSGCEVLVGPRWALVDPAFAKARPHALAERRERAGRVDRVMVTMGLADPRNATALALDGLEASGLDVAVDVAVGSASPHLAAVRARAVGVHVDAADMAGLMARADLCLGAGGTTAWERCALGLPAVIVAQAANQDLVCARLAEAGAVDYLGPVDRISPRDLGSRLARLAGDPERVLAMAERAAAICDGRGTRRLADALLDRIAAA